jgi:release factor glutamine methyltransferase
VTADRTWTILELLRWTEGHFAEQGIESARLDAECLLADVLGTTRVQLYVDFEKPIHTADRARYRELVIRRATERVPVSQLIGVKEFWSLELKVTNEVLSPRPETETLVEAGLSRLPDLALEYRVADIGTGSGAVALALASARPRAEITATDISPQALQIAKENADKLQLSERLRLVQGDLLEAVPDEQFDLVVSNPPYLGRLGAGDLPPELAHEPDIALFGGDDGYEVIRRLIEKLPDALVPGGAFAMEVGEGQADQVVAWCTEAGLEKLEIFRDLARTARVVAASRPTEKWT